MFNFYSRKVLTLFNCKNKSSRDGKNCQFMLASKPTSGGKKKKKNILLTFENGGRLGPRDET